MQIFFILPPPAYRTHTHTHTRASKYTPSSHIQEIVSLIKNVEIDISIIVIGWVKNIDICCCLVGILRRTIILSHQSYRNLHKILYN